MTDDGPRHPADMIDDGARTDGPMSDGGLHILVTNDDGIRHPGLAALAEGMRGLGRVSVLAPERNWSASGHVKTLHKPLRVAEGALADGTAGLMSNGAPSDCVALGLLGVLEHPVDIVVSGVNPYPNLGHDLTYSGTVTAAMEAVIAGVPGVAVSRAGRGPEGGYEAAVGVARRVVRGVLEEGLPPYTLLNVNVPDDPTGVRVTRQGLRTFFDALDRRTDPQGRPYYWIGGQPAEDEPDDGSDIQALAEGYVSITPIRMDLTHHGLLSELAAWRVFTDPVATAARPGT